MGGPSGPAQSSRGSMLTLVWTHSLPSLDFVFGRYVRSHSFTLMLRSQWLLVQTHGELRSFTLSDSFHSSHSLHSGLFDPVASLLVVSLSHGVRNYKLIPPLGQPKVGIR